MGKQSAQECLTSLYEPATTATPTGMAATVLATLPGMAMATHMAPPTLEHTVLATHMARHMLALHTAMATHLPMLVLMEAMLVLMAPHMAMVTHMGPHMLLATIECDRRPHVASALITRDE